MFHKLWLATIAYLSIIISLTAIAGLGLIQNFQSVFLIIIMKLFFAIYAYDLLQKRYKKEGYKMADFIMANSKEESMQKFIDNNYTTS